MAFDVHTPSPDEGHEAIRVAVLAAIAEVTDATAGVGDAYWITDLLLGMVDGLYTANADLTATVDALTARVTALEAAAVPPTAQTPEVAP